MPMIRLKRFHGVVQVRVVAFNQACMSEIRVTSTYWPDTGEEEPHTIHAELIAMMQVFDPGEIPHSFRPFPPSRIQNPWANMLLGRSSH